MVVLRPRSRAGALLLVTLSLAAVVLCAPEESPKRAPSGFLGVRGKKDVTGFSDEAVEKRVPAMGFQGVRGKKDQQDSLEQDMGYDKRGPSMGFHGMRGKKDPADTQQEFLQEFLDKRAPSMGFMGMRGKKDPLDLDYYEKRAPSLGFQGMRGKKEQWEDDSDLFKRAPNVGFHGMRGKKDLEDDYVKRMGFMGMRGKKEGELEADDYPELFADEDVWGDQEEAFTDGEDLNKRAPAAGFFGMRGKKVPAAGFFGMRGKKGPSAGFFAMRGKKAPTAGFMGMRGKKAPTAGFMGMRGKKEFEDVSESADDLESLLRYLGSTYQHGRDKRNGERAPGSKKAPSGFLGTRGKKDWPTQQVAVPARVIDPETHTSDSE